MLLKIATFPVIGVIFLGSALYRVFDIYLRWSDMKWFYIRFITFFLFFCQKMCLAAQNIYFVNVLFTSNSYSILSYDGFGDWWLYLSVISTIIRNSKPGLLNPTRYLDIFLYRNVIVENIESYVLNPYHPMSP